MEYVAASIDAAKKASTQGLLGDWATVSGVRARQRRGPIGVNLLLAPFNYPLNEMVRGVLRRRVWLKSTFRKF